MWIWPAMRFWLFVVWGIVHQTKPNDVMRLSQMFGVAVSHWGSMNPESEAVKVPEVCLWKWYKSVPSAKDCFGAALPPSGWEHVWLIIPWAKLCIANFAMSVMWNSVITEVSPFLVLALPRLLEKCLRGKLCILWGLSFLGGNSVWFCYNVYNSHHYS